MNKTYQKTFPGVKNAGFTLIELLVVVLIIGILAAVALPQYQTAVDKASVQGAIQMLYEIKRAQEMFYLVNGRYTRNLMELDMEWDPYHCTFQSYGQIALCNDELYVESIPSFSRWSAIFRYCPQNNSSWNTCVKKGNFVIAYSVPLDNTEDNAGIMCGYWWGDARSKRLCQALHSDTITPDFH